MARYVGGSVARALAAAWLLAIVVAPGIAFAHHGGGGSDPRCAQGFSTEPGVDLALLCAGRGPVGTRDGLDPGSAQLVPLIGAMIVTGLTLGIVAVIALKVGRTGPSRVRPTSPKAWWTCPACRSMNAAGRDACYSCLAAAPAPDLAVRPEPPNARRTRRPAAADGPAGLTPG